MQVLNLRKGLEFRMGRGHNWRVVHPEMGAKQLTLNHGIHEPGHEFTQHIHDGSEDCFVILEGSVSVRQGEIYTPITAGQAAFIPVGEVHGTVNTTEAPARLMSFQSPPDIALYRGERDRSQEQTPKPQRGHVSAVQVVTLAQGGPAFAYPGEWRRCVAPERGAKHLIVDYIQLRDGEVLEHTPEQTEVIYVLIQGQTTLRAERTECGLSRDDVIFVAPDDHFVLSHEGEEPAQLVRTQAQGR